MIKGMKFGEKYGTKRLKLVVAPLMLLKRMMEDSLYSVRLILLLMQLLLKRIQKVMKNGERNMMIMLVIKGGFIIQMMEDFLWHRVMQLQS